MRLLLIGFGAVHQHVARILLAKAEHLARVHGFVPHVVGVADRGGMVYHPEGLDLAALLAHKQTGASVVTALSDSPSAFAPHGLRVQPGQVREALQSLDYDLLLEASPVNLRDGEPALSFVRAALGAGKAVVLANKAPLALDYAGLHALAQQHGAQLAFSATVCGGLPVINVGRRDLVGATIHKIEGVFNSTTNYILSRMAAGEDFAAALAEAQRRGIAETDPTLDIEGWDTANKLVIIANAILGYPARLADVTVTGIAEQTTRVSLRPDSGIYKLVARALRQPDGRYTLMVRPEALAADHFLAAVSEWQMGIIFYTDLFEEIFLKIDERGPGATAAAMLRDCVNLCACTRPEHTTRIG